MKSKKKSQRGLDKERKRERERERERESATEGGWRIVNPEQEGRPKC